MRCPYCHSREIWKLSPYPWMERVHPYFKNRRCSNCGHEFAVWMGRFSMKHATCHRIMFLNVVCRVVVLVLVLGDVLTWCINPDRSQTRRIAEAVRSKINRARDPVSAPAEPGPGAEEPSPSAPDPDTDLEPEIPSGSDGLPSHLE